MWKSGRVGACTGELFLEYSLGVLFCFVFVFVLFCEVVVMMVVFIIIIIIDAITIFCGEREGRVGGSRKKLKIKIKLSGV